jgi:TonB family protein
VARVAGSTQLETGGGSILLTQVQGPLHASTGAGTITAWFASDGKVGKLTGASQLESGQGDIVVYLPRGLPVTIEATIEMAGDHRIEAEPSWPLKITYSNSGAGRVLRGECTLNGGGEVLRLKTASGNIRLKHSDTEPEIRLNQQQMKELQRRLELQRQRFVEQERRIEQQVKAQVQQVERQFERMEAQLEQKVKEREHETGRWEEWERRLEEMWLGSIRVDSETQQQKLIHTARPAYPDVARQAGIEGTVRLRAVIGKDGSVESLKVLSGHPVLVNVAREAVRRWRYQPTLVDGKPVNVLTTITVEFRLQ